MGPDSGDRATQHPPETVKLHLWAPAFIGGGGIGAFSSNLALAARDLGHDVRLISKLDVRGDWEGLSIRGTGDAPALLKTVFFSAAALAACGRGRPDQIISTHINFGPLAYCARRTLGTRYTLVAHGIDLHEQLSFARRAALRAADRVVAVSAWTRERALRLGVSAARLAILPNTVDERRFHPGSRPGTLMQRYGLKPAEKVILTVARLARAEGYKGYDRVVQALPEIEAACGPVRFLIVGDGDDRQRVEQMASDLAMRHAVTFAGFVSNDELADHYRLADVFAMPSTGEGFGIVFLEAMACGTPVLAGNCDGSVDALDGGRLGLLVTPTDPRAVTNGLVALLRRQGAPLWFEPELLHAAVATRFGRSAFRQRLHELLGS